MRLTAFWVSRCADYAALVVDVWLFMVLPTVFALTKSILPISQGQLPYPAHEVAPSSGHDTRVVPMPHPSSSLVCIVVVFQVGWHARHPRHCLR